jgi:coproporphyrinogen III oxidase
MDKNDIVQFFKSLQNDICNALESLDNSSKFKEDVWERTGGGGGRTRIFQGRQIEKGGVNFSAVYGSLDEQMKVALSIPSDNFFASGVSIVLHPTNPMVPIIHMNIRYFETGNDMWWFGGGIDVTPHYILEDDARFFHTYLKSVCDQYNSEYYPKFKTWADNYFFIRHRNETRGIGGIFFDKLDKSYGSKSDNFKFTKAVGDSFLPIYSHLFNNNYTKSYSLQNKEWQLVRRGRYVEFNLVWDRGTKFGLQTNGRIESILMSLPKQATWYYDHKPEKNSAEDKTQSLLKKDIDWVNI